MQQHTRVRVRQAARSPLRAPPARPRCNETRFLFGEPLVFGKSLNCFSQSLIHARTHAHAHTTGAPTANRRSPQALLTRPFRPLDGLSPGLQRLLGQFTSPSRNSRPFFNSVQQPRFLADFPDPESRFLRGWWLRRR